LQRHSARLFGEDPYFPTDDSRAHLVPTDWEPLAEPPERDWPLLLNTGRARDQWHTMTRTGRVPRLMMHQDQPLVIIHPDDARRYGVPDGGLARIESRHGATMLLVCLSREQRRGEIFAPMHWTDRFGSAGPIDRIVGPARDPISGQPALKATA